MAFSQAQYIAIQSDVVERFSCMWMEILIKVHKRKYINIKENTYFVLQFSREALFSKYMI